MSRRTAASKLVVCKWLRDQIRDWETAAKAELEHSGMIPDDRESGTMGDLKIGTATFCNGKRELVITDDQGFALWVQDRWPDEVETTLVVNPAFERKLVERAKTRGALIDDEGEVCPYAKFERGRSYFMAKYNPEAGIALQQMLSPRLADTMREIEQ